MVSIARRAARKVRRVLSGNGQRQTKPEVKVVQERLVVRELVLPKDEPKGPTPISELDRQSILGRYALPSLARIAPEERAELVEPMLCLERMRNLGIAPEDLEFPEASWKRVYNEVHGATESLAKSRDTVDFRGALASDLNEFLAANRGGGVQVSSPALTLDETISVPSDTSLVGNGCRLERGPKSVEKAILLDCVEGVLVSGFVIEGCCDYAVYVKQSKGFVIAESRIERCVHKAICVMGRCDQFRIERNMMRDTGNGAVFLNGDLSHGVIEGNVIERAGGTSNLSGGIVLCSSDLDDIDTPYNPLKRWCLAERLESPHEVVIKGNKISGCEANGIYSHGGYCNYVVGNAMEDNNKEGMCLDFGTFGTFVARNVVMRNGGRFDMDERKLAEDFIVEFGTLPDGSSPAKVPGISMDNAAHNVIYQNVIAENYGSGVKMVRAGVRNVVLCNEVSDNNVGQSDSFHFFGIELASDLREDYELKEVKELDLTPCYENIVARNTISGKHFSGIYLGAEAYVNDCFDNVIMETERPIECISQRHNSLINNWGN